MSVVINGTSGITGNTGTLISASTIGVGGATPSASGAGITFPATQSASTNANTLDDYEEGTWTPVASRDGVAPVFVYSQQVGTYVKIGSMVYCSCLINISSITSAGSGLNQITGLPFAAKGDSSRWTGAIGYSAALTAANFFYVISSNALGYFGNTSGGNPNTNWSTGQIYIGITYQAEY